MRRKTRPVIANVDLTLYTIVAKARMATTGPTKAITFDWEEKIPARNPDEAYMEFKKKYNVYGDFEVIEICSVRPFSQKPL